jgi:hypothetical protein
MCCAVAAAVAAAAVAVVVGASTGRPQQALPMTLVLAAAGTALAVTLAAT